MELADLVVINKADLDAAAATRAQAQITSALRVLRLRTAIPDHAHRDERLAAAGDAAQRAARAQGVDALLDRGAALSPNCSAASGQFAAAPPAAGAGLDVGAHRGRPASSDFRQHPRCATLLPQMLADVQPAALAAFRGGARAAAALRTQDLSLTNDRETDHARHPRTTRRQARRGATGRRREAHRRAARQGQADRARAAGAAAGRGHVRRVGHVRRAPLRRLRHGGQQDPGRRRGHRLRHDQRPPGVRLQPGLHRLRRRAVRGACREDLQGDGPGHEGRRAGDRPERLGRRAHPGGRGLARRLCRGVPAQRDGLGRGAADQHDHGALRRRRGVLARP